MPDPGPAAIVTISSEARAAQANEPLPVLLGQRQLTAADNLPRAGIPDESDTSTGFPAAHPEGAGNPGTAGTAEGGLGAREAGGGEGSGAPGEPEKAQGAGAPGEPEKAEGAGAPGEPDEAEDADASGPQGAEKADAAAEGQGSGSKELSAEEEQVVKELQARDREVRAHEAAHLAAAGGISKGGASFTYQSGPDGRQYAIGGEVNIDTSAEKDPRATVAKARQIQAAANAPADPSGQDRAVAAAAAQMAAEAQAELTKQGQEEMAKAMGGGKDKEPKGQTGHEPSGDKPVGEKPLADKPLGAGEAASAASPAAEPGKPLVPSRTGSGQEPPAKTDSARSANESATPASDIATPANDSATPANESATPANESTTPANESATQTNRAATPAVDPHEHPEGPGDCGPCGKLASTRVTAYA